MSKYRKKPVVIEAVELKKDNYSILNVLKFVGEVTDLDMKNPFERDAIHLLIDNIKESGLIIDTLEGKIHASIGDFIIKGIQGEFYPCKPDIFEQTYESVEESN